MNASLVRFLETNLDAFIADLQTIVAIDSYSRDRNDVNRVVELLVRWLQKLGFDIERYQHSQAGDDLVATRRGNGSKRVVLLGHSDTVFPKGTALERPMTIVQDSILGPGTCDMKAGLLTGLYAVAGLNFIDFRDYGEIIFLVVSDEEIDERHSIPLIRQICRGADAVLTLEAARSNGDIVTMRKGMRSFTAEAFGHAAHSGVEPEKGRSAILAMARQIEILEQLNSPQTDVSLNVGYIEGGRQRNIVPDYAQIRFEIRAYTDEQLDNTVKYVYELFHQETVPEVKFQVRIESVVPPMQKTPAVAKLELLAQEIAAELGFELHGAKTGGAADGTFAADEGAPVLDGLGPIGGLDHSPNEYILLSSIVPRTALLAELIVRL